MLENVLGSEIHVRMCVVYGAHNVITKSTMNLWIQKFKVGQISMSDKPQSSRPSKERPSMICCRYQQIHLSIQKMPYGNYVEKWVITWRIW